MPHFLLKLNVISLFFINFLPFYWIMVKSYFCELSSLPPPLEEGHKPVVSQYCRTHIGKPNVRLLHREKTDLAGTGVVCLKLIRIRGVDIKRVL